MLAGLVRTFVRRVARKVPYRIPDFWKGQLIAVICTAAAALARFSIEPLVHGGIPVVLFYPAVLVASVWGGTLSGVTAFVLGTITAAHFWIPAGGSPALVASPTVTLVAFGVACCFVILMAGLFRVLVEVHVENEERATLLAHEMKHRANNLFGVVQAISAQTARHASSVAEHQNLFSARLAALARAQQLLSESAESRPDLKQFLVYLVHPFGIDRFSLEGPEISVPNYLGASCALLLHELCTNAVKYGSLSVPDGKVAIAWRKEKSRVKLDWKESGGPPVTPPARTGFGTRLLKTAFPAEFGEAHIAFDPDGVRCTLHFDLI